MIAPGSASHSAWDGRIYFIEDGIRVRRIEGDGSLRTVAGPPPNAEGESAEGGFLLGNDFGQVGAIAATSKATCWSPVADSGANQIFKGEVSKRSWRSPKAATAAGPEHGRL